MRKKKEQKNNDIYDDIYRFRCYESLKERAERVARERRRGEDKSDIARLGVERLVAQEERRFGLVNQTA